MFNREDGKKKEIILIWERGSAINGNSCYWLLVRLYLLFVWQKKSHLKKIFYDPEDFRLDFI